MRDQQLTSREGKGNACELKSEDRNACTNVRIIECDARISLVSSSLTAVFVFHREYCTTGGFGCDLLCTVLNGLDQWKP